METAEWLHDLCRFPKTNSMFSQSPSHFWKVGALRRPKNTSRCELPNEWDLGLETLNLHNNKLLEQSLGAALSMILIYFNDCWVFPFMQVSASHLKLQTCGISICSWALWPRSSNQRPLLPTLASSVVCVNLTSGHLHSLPVSTFYMCECLVCTIYSRRESVYRSAEMESPVAVESLCAQIWHRKLLPRECNSCRSLSHHFRPFCSVAAETRALMYKIRARPLTMFAPE